MIEVWIGTPNEMTRAATKADQPAAVRWARDYLSGMKKQAEKYDRAALDRLQRVSDEMGATAFMTEGAVRMWEVPYISITFRIELRRPK